MTDQKIDFWNNAVDGSRKEAAEIEIQMILPDQPDGGSSRPIKIQATDGNMYWIKLTENPQGQRTLVNDQIVARIGKLIGASVCDVAIVGVPGSMAGTKLTHGRTLPSGLAHGSRHVNEAEFNRRCGYKNKDDNRHRMATLMALYDLCCGDDDQWLFATGQDYTVFSHDHGHYFEHQWNLGSLEQLQTRPFLCRAGFEGLSADSVAIMAQRIRGVTPEQIRDILACVPLSWHVSDAELNQLGKLVDCRRDAVATRLEEMAKSLEKGLP